MPGLIPICWDISVLVVCYVLEPYARLIQKASGSSIPCGADISVIPVHVHIWLMLQIRIQEVLAGACLPSPIFEMWEVWKQMKEFNAALINSVLFNMRELISHGIQTRQSMGL
jgi:hypothetical protein